MTADPTLPTSQRRGLAGAPELQAVRERLCSYIESLQTELNRYPDLMQSQRAAAASGNLESLQRLMQAEAVTTRRMTDLARCIHPLLDQLGLSWPNSRPAGSDGAGPRPAFAGVLHALWRVEELRRAAMAENSATLEAIRQRMPEVREQLTRLRQRDPAVRRSRGPEHPSFIDLQA